MYVMKDGPVADDSSLISHTSKLGGERAFKKKKQARLNLVLVFLCLTKIL